MIIVARSQCSSAQALVDCPVPRVDAWEGASTGRGSGCTGNPGIGGRRSV